MAVGCGPKFAKILLIIFNIIFWLSGAALLGIGIWLLVDKSIVSKFDVFSVLEGSGSLLQYASYVLIGVGAVVLLVGFFGCCGAIKENRCMLGVYIVFLVIIMAAEIAAGVLALVYKEKIEKELTTQLTEQFKERYGKTGKEDKAFTEGLNAVQVEFKCCGIGGESDYSGISKDVPRSCCVLRASSVTKDAADLTDDDVEDVDGCEAGSKDAVHGSPVSCCELKSSAKDKSAKDLKPEDAVDYTACKANSGREGCVGKLEQWIKDKSIILIGVGIGIACLELFGFIFAVCLCRNVGDED